MKMFQKRSNGLQLNQKYIFIIVGIVAAVLVLGFLGFDKYVQQPKESSSDE